MSLIRPTLVYMTVAGYMLSACQQVWYLTVLDSGDVSAPIYCVSSKPACGGDPIDMKNFSVDQVDEEGRTIGAVWAIEVHESSHPVKEIRHGIAPPGWRALREAEPLDPGKYYRVRNQYFACSIIRGELRCRVSTEIGNVVGQEVR